VFYINLASRTDRLADIQNECAKMDLAAERVEASLPAPGTHAGFACTASHIRCLEMAQARGWPYVLILEDDFTFLCSKETLDQFVQRVVTSGAVDFDVIMLAYNNQGQQLDDLSPEARGLGLGRVSHSFTSSGYIVHSRFYDTLLHNLRTSIQVQCLLDIFWKHLQPRSNWFYTLQRMGKQRASYSDIERRTVDYGV
jgi:hypothetical protein